MRYIMLSIVTWGLTVFAIGPKPITSFFRIEPNSFSIPEPVTSTVIRREFLKKRKFSQQDGVSHFPSPSPLHCKALLARYSSWMDKVASSAAGGKFATIEYVDKAADCMMLRDLMEATPSPVTPQEATALIASGKPLSGDFFPELPSEGKKYEITVAPMDGEKGRKIARITLGTPEVIPPNRNYWVLATMRRGSEITADTFLAIEMRNGGNYAMCSYVWIEADAFGRFFIPLRQELGRCG